MSMYGLCRQGGVAGIKRLTGLLLMLMSFQPICLAENVTVVAAKPAIKAPLSSRSLMLDVAYRDAVAMAVGERGHILIACADCSDWHQANVPVSATLTAVHMVNGSTAFAVGHDAVILKTTDGGENWQIQYRDPALQTPFLDVWFKDEMNGFAIGAYGLFMTTADGGKSWQKKFISEDDFHLNQLSYSDQHGYFIAAEAGVIYHSNDGQQWEVIESPYEGSFFDLQRLPDNSLLLVGLRGNAYISEDGRDWQAVDTQTESLLTSITVLSTGQVLVTGMAGTLLLSEDGRQFNKIQKADRKGLAAVAEQADGQILSVGEAGIRHLRLE